MKSQCLPFRQIPHTSQLFSDYISDFAKVEQFYSREPRFSAWVKDKNEESRRTADPQRRKRVADALERQNQKWGASAKTLANIDRLREGAAAVVTGQQVGLFGGPLFVILKALTAVKLAEQAHHLGVDAVPVFWLATADHDLAEINHTNLPAADGLLRAFSTSTQGVADAPVGEVIFGAEIEPVIEAAAALLGESDATTFLREAYRPGESFGSAFARFYSRIFAEWGIIFLDAADAELNAIAAPIYQAAIARAGELNDALLARSKAIEAAGYPPQVKVTAASTLLFAVENGSRIPVHRRAARAGHAEEFLMREQEVSQTDLLARIATQPHQFSGNVLLRPIVQDYLLPTLAYCGGAAEIAYFAQVQVVYEALLGVATPIVPRFSATIVEAKPQAALEKYELTLTDVFAGPEGLREKLAQKTLPHDLRLAFERAESSLEKSLADIAEALQQVDKTLVDAASNAGSKMQFQLESLRAKAARAELRHTEVLTRKAELLSNLLYPNKTLQEREIAGVYFVARYGLQFLNELYELLSPECLDHQVISI